MPEGAEVSVQLAAFGPQVLGSSESPVAWVPGLSWSLPVVRGGVSYPASKAWMASPRVDESVGSFAADVGLGAGIAVGARTNLLHAEQGMRVGQGLSPDAAHPDGKLPRPVRRGAEPGNLASVWQTCLWQYVNAERGWSRPA